MQYSELITDRNAFVRLSEECCAVFDIAQRLPSQVFRGNFKKYYEFEYGQILSKYFAPFLTKVAQKASDKAVNYMTLEPDPSYYFNNYGFFGLASFEPVNLISNYINVMNRDGVADSFRARGGDIAVLWGSSLEWGIFCDRKAWDLCVMGVSLELDQSIISKLNIMDSTRVKNYISTAYHWKPSVAIEFLDEFFKNYSEI